MGAKNENMGFKAEVEASSAAGSKPEQNSKPAEPPKQDYIHVRARRGQATDSHSLAERVIHFNPIEFAIFNLKTEKCNFYIVKQTVVPDSWAC